QELERGWDEEEIITLPIGLSVMDNFRYTENGPVYSPKNRTLGVTPLVLAAAEGRDAAVCILLGFSNIDKEPDSGVTALFMALYYNRISTAKMLLRQGAKVKASGYNALHAAPKSGSCEMITDLVKLYYVNVNVEDIDGATPIVYALQQPDERARSTILHLRCLKASEDLKLDHRWTFKDIARAIRKHSLVSEYGIPDDIFHLFIRLTLS
ncbi:ankyrin repeat-containing domain protein, partial [Dactylonectria estremocensis]